MGSLFLAWEASMGGGNHQGADLCGAEGCAGGEGGQVATGDSGRQGRASNTGQKDSMESEMVVSNVACLGRVVEAGEGALERGEQGANGGRRRGRAAFEVLLVGQSLRVKLTKTHSAILLSHLFFLRA